MRHQVETKKSSIVDRLQAGHKEARDRANAKWDLHNRKVMPTDEGELRRLFAKLFPKLIDLVEDLDVMKAKIVEKWESNNQKMMPTDEGEIRELFAIHFPHLTDLLDDVSAMSVRLVEKRQELRSNQVAYGVHISNGFNYLSTVKKHLLGTNKPTSFDRRSK